MRILLALALVATACSARNIDSGDSDGGARDLLQPSPPDLLYVDLTQPQPRGCSTGCRADQFCDTSACGRSGGIGMCAARPQACPAIYSPVCGCDGESYGNECDAHANGTDVDYSGKCATTVRVCGGRAGNTCAALEFCDFPAGQMCDWADGQGTCQLRPNACTLDLDPVCGCDGKDYGNECEAQAAGTDAAYHGTCGKPTKDCRDTGCQSGSYCTLCWANYACIPDNAVC